MGTSEEVVTIRANHPENSQQESVYHLDRIASAVESIAETWRLSYEMSIDTAAKTNALTDSMAGLIGDGLSSLLGGIDEPPDTD